MDFHFAAPAQHIFWLHYRPVKLIRYFQINWQFLRSLTLIINIFSLCRPLDRFSVLGKRFVTFYIRNPRQIGFITDCSVYVRRTFQPVRHRNLGNRTVGARVHIDRFLFANLLRLNKGTVA